jgi:hypothetical protein
MSFERLKICCTKYVWFWLGPEKECPKYGTSLNAGTLNWDCTVNTCEENYIKTP